MDINGILKVINAPTLLSGGLILFGSFVFIKAGDFGIKKVLGTTTGLLVMAAIVRYAATQVWGSISGILIEVGKLL